MCKRLGISRGGAVLLLASIMMPELGRMAHISLNLPLVLRFCRTRASNRMKLLFTLPLPVELEIESLTLMAWPASLPMVSRPFPPSVVMCSRSVTLRMALPCAPLPPTVRPHNRPPLPQDGANTRRLALHRALPQSVCSCCYRYDPDLTPPAVGLAPYGLP